MTSELFGKLIELISNRSQTFYSNFRNRKKRDRVKQNNKLDPFKECFKFLIFTRFDIVGEYFEESITIKSCMFVPKPDHVTDFMKCGAVAETFRSQVDSLPHRTVHFPNVRRTAIWGRNITNYGSILPSC